MAKGITQSAIIVLSFATDIIDKIDLRYSVKHCSKEASLNVSSTVHSSLAIRQWLGSRPRICLGYKVPESARCDP